MKRILVLVCLVLFIGSFVSAEYATAEDRFVKNNNGTITDTQTGMMWADQDNGVNINWYGATSYCGGGGWRMPTIDELRTLHSSGVYGSLIKKTGSWVWSSEHDNSTNPLLSKAASFRFTDGSKQMHSKYDADGDRALRVRSAK